MNPRLLTRRSLLQQGFVAGASLPFAGTASLFPPGVDQTAHPFTPLAGQLPFTKDDDALLEDVEHSNFQYFWDQANPETGLVRDRCNVTIDDKNTLCSIAAVGFGLTAICIGVKRGYVPRAEARDRVLNTLRFLWKKLPNHRGFFYHWANLDTGERQWDSEVSSIDTAILLCGVLTARAFFEHSEISELARLIFDRVEWTWLSEDTRLLSHGWTPEGGFLPYRWDNYSENMMIYLLGLGSTTHPLPPEAWAAWKRTIFEYDGIQYIGSFAPLFVHQYSQAWFDFRNKRDAYADYFKNSILATEAHRRFCMDLSGEFPDYSADLWGITASDSEKGYVAWGGPPATGPIDGTVVPCASAGSLPFLPQECIRVLHTIRNKYSFRAWCKYGFVDAFNPLTNWYDTDVVGIDTGITILMAENARSGFVWDIFMKNPEAIRGMQRAGFKPDE